MQEKFEALIQMEGHLHGMSIQVGRTDLFGVYCLDAGGNL